MIVKLENAKAAAIMGFLSVSKEKESKSKVISPEAIGQEAFDFIYEQYAVEGARPGERYLEIAHFESLATAIHLNLEDLSLYLVAFLVDESSKMIFKISEKRFVAWLTGLATSLPRGAAPPTRENAFASLFTAAYAAVIELNSQLRANEEQRIKFYYFLYNWCLKGNTASDRVDIAKELWSCFFSVSPLSFSKKEAELKFTAYVCFPRINQWLDFISTLTDKAKEVKQGPSALDQMGVSFDTWSQLIPFSKVEDYSSYNDEDAWPVAMDDFVEYVRKLEKSKNA